MCAGVGDRRVSIRGDHHLPLPPQWVYGYRKKTVPTLLAKIERQTDSDTPGKIKETVLKASLAASGWKPEKEDGER